MRLAFTDAERRALLALRPPAARRPLHRDRFRERLKANGVQTTWYPALHTFTEYLFAPPMGCREPRWPTACALPLSSTMSEVEIEIRP